MEKIYVIGHKSPDTDTICSSIAYAYFKNQLEETNKYEARRTGELNEETKLVLEKFKVPVPELLTNISGKKVILVDHNEMGQVVDGIENAEVLEIIDHHKIGDLQTKAPILFHAEPVGSTCTIVADFMFYHRIPIPDKIAGLLLSGILSDTVILKSPTTTEKDRKYVKLFSKQLDIDYEKYGMEIKKAKSSIAKLTPNEIITKDFKEFNVGKYKFGVGQIEVVDYSEAIERKNEIMKELDLFRQANGYIIAALMVTNILKEETKLWFSGDELVIKKAFNKEPKDNEVYLPGVMSRKKQVVPPIQEALKEL